MDTAATHLRQRRVQLENLPLALHLAHAYFAGQIHGGGGEALQGEAAVEVPLGAAPHVLEGELLRAHERETFTFSGSPCALARPRTPPCAPTWYLASSLLFQSVCGTSWMEILRLWVLSLKLRVFGSSNSFPPICFSICRTSWGHRHTLGQGEAAAWPPRGGGHLHGERIACAITFIPFWIELPCPRITPPPIPELNNRV